MAHVKVIPFELRLKDEIQTSSSHRLSSREGFQLFLNSNGRTGRGECTPLPGLHVESWQECLSVLEGHPGPKNKIIDQLEQTTLQVDRFRLREPHFNLLERPLKKLPPPLEYALDEALLSWYLKAEPLAIQEIFGVHSSEFSVPVNGLLIPDMNSLKNSSLLARSISEAGFRTLKIKVGRLPPRYELEVIRSLLLALTDESSDPSPFQIRLDGNRLFTETSFFEFSDLLETQGIANHIEYFEEPLPEYLYESYHHSPLPIALDESIPHYLNQTKTRPTTITTLVVKPTVLGGIPRTIQCVDLCNDLQLKCVLSSAFESGWTISHLGLLSQLVRRKTAMGLDTYKYLEDDTLQERLTYSQGRLNLYQTLWD